MTNQRSHSLSYVVVFKDLPYGLQDRIFEKIDYHTFTYFDEFCQFTHEMCRKTKKKFTLNRGSVVFKGNKWILGASQDCLSTEDLKNAFLEVFAIKLGITLTDEACILLMSHVNARSLTCNAGINCSREGLKQLLEVLGVKFLTVSLNQTMTDFEYDTSKLHTIRFYKAGYLSTKAILALNVQDKITIRGLGFENIKARIESMMEKGGCETIFEPGRESPNQVVSRLLRSFGSRAELIDRTDNCWSLTDEKSDEPCFFMVLTSGNIYIIPREKFNEYFNAHILRI